MLQETYLLVIFAAARFLGDGSQYGWKTIDTNSWTDVSCDTDGCFVCQNYYECTGEFVNLGCYSSRLYSCYWYEILFDPCIYDAPIYPIYNCL